MSRATPDDQLKFLLSCVRYSNNGKIDFVEVARECGVVSKGAAAKRYERLLKANGIHPSGGTSDRPAASSPKPKSRLEIARSAAAKRRKIEGDLYAFKADYEDELERGTYFKSEAVDSVQIKPEPGIEHRPCSWKPTSSPVPTFFPRMPLPPGIAPGLPVMALPPMYQSPPSRPSYAMPPIMRPPMMADHYSTNTNSPAPFQGRNGPLSRLQSTSKPVTVSEDEITSMLDDFCAQDIFKQPNFESAPSVPAPAPTLAPALAPAPDTTSTLTSIVTENDELSPCSLEKPALSSSEISQPSLSAQREEPALAAQPVAETPAVRQPDGSAVENSILIID